MPVVKVSKGIKEVEIGQVHRSDFDRPGVVDRFSGLGQNQRQ